MEKTITKSEEIKNGGKEVKGEFNTYWDYMHKAEKTEEVLNNIPSAEAMTIDMKGQYTQNNMEVKNPKEIKAIVVDGKIVASVSKQYKLVQHKEAFEPIFKGLHQTGADYDFALFQTDTKAFLSVFVDEVAENGSGIKLGFRATNSIDGRNAITYAMSSTSVDRKTEIVAKAVKVVDVWGFRQVCSNGMKIRVPLVEHEEIRLFKETTEKVESLMNMAANIAHVGEVGKKIEAVQYVVEAMALLREPIAGIIKLAKDREIGVEDAKKLIGKYVGKRLNDRIFEQYGKEEQSLWGLYNAITYVASHGEVKVPTMNGLIEKAADLLEGEVFETSRGATPAVKVVAK